MKVFRPHSLIFWSLRSFLFRSTWSSLANYDRRSSDLSLCGQIHCFEAAENDRNNSYFKNCGHLLLNFCKKKRRCENLLLHIFRIVLYNRTNRRSLTAKPSTLYEKVFQITASDAAGRLFIFGGYPI